MLTNSDIRESVVNEVMNLNAKLKESTSEIRSRQSLTQNIVGLGQRDCA